MKASLSIKLGQQLTLTPQLRQAIHLLTLSAAELESEINLALESNPLLERAEEAGDNDSDDAPAAADTAAARVGVVVAPHLVLPAEHGAEEIAAARQVFTGARRKLDEVDARLTLIDCVVVRHLLASRPPVTRAAS